jgi:hypothetical protein
VTSRALVVGGQGFFGRAVVDDLLANTGADIVVAGRRRRTPVRLPRLSWRTFDLERPGPVGEFEVVVCCAGPYQGMSTALVEAAAAAGVPYVDLADARDFIARARRIPSRAPVMTGLSAVPGFTCLLAARAGVGRPRRIRTLIAPGSRPQRGGATLSSLLSGIDRWGAREEVRFPAPVGRRAMYRTIPVGDADLVPELFDGADFEFKVGFDLDLFNRGLEAVSWLRRRRWIPDPRRSMSLFGAVVRALSFLGTAGGAVRVEVRGDQGRYAGNVVARDRGYRIPAVLAAIAAARILECRLTESRLDRWLPDLSHELSRRHIELVEERSS